jgi:tRNA pseudouridine55 synthase
LSDPFGFLNIDKPLEWTSHDVVGRVRRALKLKKVGHAGTLDPLATGVLILCLGQATRLSEFAMYSTKRYRARIRLGVQTTTYDAEGEITAQVDPSHLTRAAIESALIPFLGVIEQIPPLYSAIKQGGRKLYELAREGKTAELKPRPVRIDTLEVIDWSPPEITIDVTCSAGTYIRSLAHDLGLTLGVGAHLAGLIRTGSGAFRLEDATALDDMLADPDWRRRMIAPDVALQHLPRIDLDARDTDHIRHGRAPEGEYAVHASLARAYDSGGVLLAIVEARDGRWRPHKVFLSAE